MSSLKNKIVFCGESTDLRNFVGQNKRNCEKKQKSDDHGREHAKIAGLGHSFLL
jgi:hypothetical protein